MCQGGPGPSPQSSPPPQMSNPFSRKYIIIKSLNDSLIIKYIYRIHQEIKKVKIGFRVFLMIGFLIRRLHEAALKVTM